MKMKDVIISVTGIQTGPGGPDSMQLVTAGRYGLDSEQICMTWEESELTGMEGTHTSLTIQDSGVVLSREGKHNSSMEFTEGKKSYFLYETPYGSATMGLDTQRIRSRFDMHGGHMEIEYTIDMDQSIVGRNRFFIQVKEPKESHTGDIRWPI